MALPFWLKDFAPHPPALVRMVSEVWSTQVPKQWADGNWGLFGKVKDGGPCGMLGPSLQGLGSDALVNRGPVPRYLAGSLVGY